MAAPAAIESLVITSRKRLSNRVLTRKRAWCQQECKDSRLLHLRIWQSRPSIAYVRTVIIPLLKRMRRAVLLAKRGVPDRVRSHLDEYADNIAVRTANLSQRYCESLPSAIRPGDLLKVPKRVLRRPQVSRLAN